MTGSNSISVTLNGQKRDVAPGLTVTGLLEFLGLNPALVVVERNREILDRSLYAKTPVESGDSFELVHFVGGG